MDFFETAKSIKDIKLQHKQIKKANQVIITDDGMTIEQLVDEHEKLKADYNKLESDFLQSQSKNLQVFNKLITNQDILLDKVSKLENQVATLLSK